MDLMMSILLHCKVPTKRKFSCCAASCRFKLYGAAAVERSAFLGSYVRETRIGNAGPLGTACEPKSKIYETLNESPFLLSKVYLVMRHYGEL